MLADLVQLLNVYRCWRHSAAAQLLRHLVLSVLGVPVYVQATCRAHASSLPGFREFMQGVRDQGLGKAEGGPAWHSMVPFMV